jgi:lipopolysaccharide/colanic/teichoic acid biosynthesis glycosyltransferase
MHKGRAYYPVIKRVLDIFGAVILLILSSPIMLVIAILVRFKLGKPVIFAQPRPGLNEKVFNLYKFRSMKNVDESRGLITDEQRLNKFGKKLRSTSLDELPSLWNVLRGDMSFVGPRPLLVEYLPLYSKEQKKRHKVRPGISGLSQVNGRNHLSWEDKFNLDVKYTKTISFELDIKIILRTFVVVIKRSEINSPGSESSSKFSRDS